MQGAVVASSHAQAPHSKDMKPKRKSKKSKDTAPVCTVCGDPATTTVDGEPSCDKHVALVYENQVEDYTVDEQANNAWVKP
jgi:hypothetical protein